MHTGFSHARTAARRAAAHPPEVRDPTGDWLPINDDRHAVWKVVSDPDCYPQFMPHVDRWETPESSHNDDGLEPERPWRDALASTAPALFTIAAFTQLAELEPTFSARKAAALLGRSFSWLDQRVRNGDFVQSDGTTLQPLRTAAGYRYFTIEMLQDIAKYCYRQRRYSFEELKSVIRELVMAAHVDTGDDEILG